MGFVVCPLCQSENVHQSGQTDDLAIYACNLCNAQFTIQLPPKRRDPYVAGAGRIPQRPKLERRKKPST
jgi:transposase-like protein